MDLSTLAVDGLPIPGVVDRLKALGEQLSLHALTAGTHGNIAELEHLLGLPLRINTTSTSPTFTRTMNLVLN